MRWTMFVIGLAVACLLCAGHDSQAQRRGGGGGARAGGAGGMGGSGAARGGAVTGPYGGAGVGARSTGTVVGPAGGSRTVNSGGGSYTTKGGTTIDYGGVGAKGSTAGGVNYGKGVGGVQITGPGGNTVNKVARVGGVSGPGGNAAVSRGGVTTGTGPNGSFGTAYKGGVAVGPQGGAAGGTRVGTATGPGGNTITGGARAGVASGPYGAVAGGSRVGVASGPGGTAVAGSRTVAGRTPYGTYYASRSALATTGGVVRSNFGYYHTFTPGWYARYPGAWFVAGWTAARIWSAPGWGAVAGYCGYPSEPAYYDYGETVVYSGDAVVINGETEVPAAAYDQEAANLAAAGKGATPMDAEDFQPLGVFALAQEGEEKSTNIFQLAVNKEGLIRGNYYNALTDATDPIYGAVDRKTQKAAWTVADRKLPVFEAGIANLTRPETSILVHFAKDDARQFMLVRLELPAEGTPAGAPAPNGPG